MTEKSRLNNAGIGDREASTNELDRFLHLVAAATPIERIDLEREGVPVAFLQDFAVRLAILLGNSLRYFEVAWGARRAGLYYVPISTHLTNAETVIADSGAKTLFIAATLLPSMRACCIPWPWPTRS